MRVLDVREPFNIDLLPNESAGIGDVTTLYFGLIEFVREIPQVVDKTTKVKCIVWDLDNTLWDGTLVEDGPNKLSLNPTMVEIIRALDDRGILHSIASKNNYDDAFDMLKRLHIDEYFVCPQICWQPKSESIRAIAHQLNIGMDTIIFVDDSQFEIVEVKAICPEVRTLDALRANELLEMNECLVPVTAESKVRRKMYQVEAERKKSAREFGDDYMEFLCQCRIQLTVGPMSDQNIERVHELTQRTNQMNFSGNRYDREVLRSILSAPYLDTYVISCEDRFGSYGVVGFSIVDSREPRMTDLMFSCRIQSKRVEHAFLSYMLTKYRMRSVRDFFANYRRTTRNAPSGKVFADLGMEEVGVSDGLMSLVFRKDKVIPEDGIVAITAQEDPVGSV